MTEIDDGESTGMSPRHFMNFLYLNKTEAESSRDFAAGYSSFEAYAPELIDTLFRLTYFMGKKASEEDGYHYVAIERVHRVPYCVRAVWLLTSFGYYAEAALLIRQLLENFVQLRYFAKYPHLFIKHFTSQSRNGKVSFQTMFDEFSVGYYDRHYRFLASIAHGGAGFSVFSGMEKASEGSGLMLAPLGCKYDEKQVSFLINHLLTLTGGYLACVPDWFPSYANLVDSDTESDRVKTLANLATWRRGATAAHPHLQPWMERTSLLMNTKEKKS